MILASVDTSVGSVTPYVVKSEYGVVLAHALEFIAHTYHLDRIGNLSLDVRFAPFSAALGIIGASSILLSLAREVAIWINLGNWCVWRDFLSLCFMKIVLFFKFGRDFLTAPVEEILIQPFAFLVDIYRHDMYVVAVNILMLIDDVWLFAEAEFIKILAGEYLKILVGKSVIRMRIERDMQYRLLGLAHLRHEQTEVLSHLTDVSFAVNRYDNLVRA